MTVAQCTTSTPRRWGAAKQATTCREDQELLRSFQQLGQPLGHIMYKSKGKLAKMNYMDIKLLLDRCIVKNKRGSLTEQEIQMLVEDWHDRRSEGDLRLETIQLETKSMEKKLRKYNVDELGETPLEQDDGTIQILVCQTGGCVRVEAREFEIARLKNSYANTISTYVAQAFAVLRCKRKTNMSARYIVFSNLVRVLLSSWN